MPTVKLISKEDEPPVVLTIGEENKVGIDINCCCTPCCAEIIAEYTTNRENPDWDITIYSSTRIENQTNWILIEGATIVDCAVQGGYPRNGYKSGTVVDHYMKGLSVFHSIYQYDGHMKLIVYCKEGSYGGHS
jgi:hypothetical protein